MNRTIETLRGIIPLASLLLLTVTTRASAQTHDLAFSTYLGGSGVENLRDVTSDADGNVYVTGGTSSANYPTTPGAYDRTFATGGSSLGTGGPMDVFVAKYAADGTLLWSTLLGGPNYDRAYAIEVDADGYVYVGGRAGDAFPVTAGALQTAFGGDLAPNTAYGKQDAFVAKLSPDGDSLLWATYFGADDIAFARDIDIDADGNVYMAVTGVTRSTPHVTAGAFQTTPGGSDDMSVAKIAADGSRVLWASYYGGSGSDGAGPSIRVHPDGSATILGGTTSTDLPTAGAGSDRSFNGGRDIFVARFTPDGSALRYATYLGGSGNESIETHNLAIDADGDAYASGYTTSTDLPTTPGALFDSFRGGGGDIPLFRVDGDDGTLRACSYLGGSGGEGNQGIAIGRDGGVVIGGGTNSPDYPTTPDAIRTDGAGGYDMVVTVLEPDFTDIRYSTLVGGSGGDDGRTLWATPTGEIYLAGHTSSTDIPRRNPAQAAHGGGTEDGVIVSLAPSDAVIDTVDLQIFPDCRIDTEGSGSGFLLVVAVPAAVSPITLHLEVGGTADAGDHGMRDTALRIAAGESGAQLLIPMFDDAFVEGTELIEIRVTGVDGAARMTDTTPTLLYLIDDEAPPANLLVDPGFELDPTPWQKTTNGGRAIATDQANGGARSLRMEGSNEFNREVFQDVAVEPGALYFSGASVRNDGIDTFDPVVEILWLNDAGMEISRDVVMTVPSFGAPVWASVVRCAVAPPGAATARFRLSIPVENDGEGTIWFDDLKLLRAAGSSDVPAARGDERRLDLSLGR